MNLVDSEDLKEYAKFTNYLEQSIKVNALTFANDKFDGAFLEYFNGADSITISRSDVFDAFSKNSKDGILSAFMWGFPTGGRGTSAINLIKNLDFYIETIDLIKKVGVNKFLFEKINSKPRVNYATTSKFLYFSNAKTSYGASLIFDQRVSLFITEYQPVDFQKTFSCLREQKGYKLPHNSYISYVKECNELADKLKTYPDIVEMYLFERAPMKRKPKHLAPST